MTAISVFLADDHAVVRDGLSVLLDAEDDIKVVGDASDGRETIDKVAALCPDVVVMDIAMPELNGIDATQKIVQACIPTQVIILSMHSTTEHISGALKAGARGYILKESAGVEVVNAVRVVFRGHYYLSQKISDNVVDDYVQQAQIAGAASPIDSLSIREREVLQMLVEGKSNAEIGEILSISIKTVETYRSRLMLKLDINDIPSLVKFAIQHGLTSLE